MLGIYAHFALTFSPELYHAAARFGCDSCTYLFFFSKASAAHNDAIMLLFSSVH